MGEPERRAANPSGAVERAITLLMRTNRCDRVEARQILRTTARRNRVDELELAVTLLALANTPRSPRRPL